MSQPTKLPDNPKPSDPDETTFESLAEQSPPSVVAEFWDFLRNNRKWWLTPIIVVLLLSSLLILLTGTAVGPFIYVLF